MNTHWLSGDSTTGPVAPLPSTLEDVTNFVVRRARELVDELVKQRECQEPPFLAEELSKLQGIKEIIKTDLGEVDALLLRRADGYIMKLNAAHPPTRQNFSCAHEIAHTFLHELELRGWTESAEFRTIGSDMSSRAKERLCHIAAAELLMPEAIFRKYLQGFGVSVNSIDRLAHTFRVSLPAAAIRIGEVSIEPCITIIWKRSRIWKRSPKTISEGFITKHNGKSMYVRDHSALLTAYESDRSVRSFRSFEIGGIKKRCLMESKGFGRDKWRYVISLIFPERQCKA